MYYVYLLTDNNDYRYVGFTSDLKQRISDHKRGIVKTTSKFDNLILAYYEAYVTENEARTRERKLKQYGSAYQGLLKRLQLT